MVRFWGTILLLAFLVLPTHAAERLTLASTTSTDNSGLFEYLLPKFTEQTGIAVNVIAVGTGQALRLGQNGDADIVLVHHPESEQRFVAQGYGTARLKVMFNDFVIVGPGSDPAELSTAKDAYTALRRIRAAGALFASRGDESGTHRAEQSLWQDVGGRPDAATDGWYREMGAGMGATLNAAVALDAYALTDRATWLGFANRRDHRILFQGDPLLFNQYSVMPVNPARHPHVRGEAALQLVNWLVSPAGQKAISDFRLRGEQVFFPNADPGN